MSVQQGARANRKPWNAGRIVGAKPPLKPQHIWALRTRLQMEKRVRDLAMFNVAIDSKLRGCDLVRLRLGDVTVGGTVRTRSTVIQQKTGRPVPFELTATTRSALAAWLCVRLTGESDWLWPSRSRAGGHITTAIRASGRSLDGSDRARPRQLRYPQPEANEGVPRLQADGQPACLSASAGSHQAGEHGSISRYRSR